MDYSIAPARYSRTGAMVIQPNNSTEFRGRADRLAATFGKWSHRARGYVVRPTAIARFETLYAAGWDANYLDGGAKARYLPAP